MSRGTTRQPVTQAPDDESRAESGDLDDLHGMFGDDETQADELEIVLNGKLSDEESGPDGDTALATDEPFTLSDILEEFQEGADDLVPVADSDLSLGELVIEAGGGADAIIPAT